MKTKERNLGEEKTKRSEDLQKNEPLNKKELLSDEELLKVAGGVYPCSQCEKIKNIVMKNICLTDCEGSYDL